jgi:hypothetical protein
MCVAAPVPPRCFVSYGSHAKLALHTTKPQVLMRSMQLWRTTRCPAVAHALKAPTLVAAICRQLPVACQAHTARHMHYTARTTQPLIYNWHKRYAHSAVPL